MPYAPAPFVTTSVITPTTKFSEYPAEINKMMLDSGSYLAAQVALLSAQYSSNTGYTANVLDGKFAERDAAIALKQTASLLVGAIGNINSPLLDMPMLNSSTMKSGVGSATFTRASTATYIDRYGVLKTAAINEPRFEKEGYLNEGASTNLLTYSEQFDHASWSKGSITIVANTTETLDPYGTNLAAKFSETAVASDHPIYKVYSFVAGTSYTQSMFAKVGTRTRIELNFQSISFTANQRVDFDLVSKTGAVIQGTPTYRIEELANGWFRLSITATATITALSGFVFGMLNDSGAISYLGDITKYMYIFGAKLEASPFASSYIPTVASAVTRAGDILSVSYLNNTAGCNNRFSEETLMLDIVRKPQIGIAFIFTTLFSGTAYRWYASALTIVAQYGNDTVGGSQLPSNTAPYVKYRIALSHDKSGITKVYVNGVLTATGTSGNTNSGDVIAGLYIGHGGNGSGQCSGHYSNFRIYDKALTNQEVALA